MTTETLNGDTTNFVDGVWSRSTATFTDGGAAGTFLARNYSSSANTQSMLGLTFPSGATDPVRADPDGTHTLTLQLRAVSPATAQVVEAWLVVDPVSTAWSATYLPPDQFMGANSALNGHLRQLGTATVSASTAADTDVAITLDDGALSALTQHNDWDESFNIIVTNQQTGDLDFKEMGVGGATASTAARFTWDHISELESGISSRRQSMSRVDRCPICGFRSFRENWSWCGYHKRLECPKCIDPRDHLDPPRFLGPELPLVGED